MAVYVDGLFVLEAREAQALRVGARNGHRWCHLYADTEEELHAFAYRLGMLRVWAQRSRRGIVHYDLTPRRRAHAVRLGAVELDRRQARGLRTRILGELAWFRDLERAARRAS